MKGAMMLWKQLFQEFQARTMAEIKSRVRFAAEIGQRRISWKNILEKTAINQKQEK
jgi:hypothetical protein